MIKITGMYFYLPISLRSLPPTRSSDFERGNFSTVVQSSIYLSVRVLFYWFLISLPRPLAAEEANTASHTEIKAPSPEQLEFFEKQVRPVLVEHCYECHSERADGGLQIDSREGLLRGGDSGAALIPGNSDTSLLIEAVRYQNLDFQMPPQGKLDLPQIAALENG